MTRHGKNCTAGAVYSYHERKKDTAASGYGTQRVRVGRDAIKDFDCCCLSLQPCRDPVVTPDGFLYEREAIVGFLLHQKNKIARETKAWQRQRAQRRRQREQLRGEGAAKALRGFLEAETPLGKGETPPGSAPPGPLPSFWIPSLTPEAGAEQLQKPDASVRCPMSGRKLRLAQLVSVHFTPAEPGLSPGQLLAREPSDRYVCALTRDPLGNATPCAVLRPSDRGAVPQDASVRCPMSGRKLRLAQLVSVHFTPAEPGLSPGQLLAREPSDRYVCALTRDPLGNATPCAVLRPSGAVVTLDCVDRLIRKDMRDPLSGDPLSDGDIIELQRGGTGFAGAGVSLEAKKSRPVMQA